MNPSIPAAASAAVSSTPAYDTLAAHFTQLHRFEHVTAIAGWDRSANMPPGGNEARSAALGEMMALMHRMRKDPKLADAIARAEQESLDEMQRANLREIQRHHRNATAVPDSLVQAKEMASSRCEHAWRTQRPANDWQGFAPNLEAVLAIVRQEAELLSQRHGVSRYDALMEQYEPGMKSAEVERIFGEVSSWLPGLIEQVVARQANESMVAAQGPFDVAKQRMLCERVMRLLDFDFNAGRLDVSAHPFSGGVPEDVRMTTRYRDDDFLQSLMGTVHETGHGRYEQNRPREWLGQPVSEARSMGIHESQSLAFEMQLGSHPGFARLIAPLVRDAFGPQPAFEAQNLWRLMTRVKRGLIRVDADEVTYPAHVILRFEIERDLVEGRMSVRDMPAAWDEKMHALLQLDTRGNFKDGPMQDVHWPSGAFGYFPSYTLGAMYAAQWFATMRKEIPKLDDRIEGGDLQPVFGWLRDRIWRNASRWTTDELTRRVSGEALNPAHFRAHLQQRYLG